MKPFLIAAAVGLFVAPVFADVNITPDMPWVTVQTEDGEVEISRIDDPAHELSGEWARTSRNCPNFCVQPMVPRTRCYPRLANWSF